MLCETPRQQLRTKQPERRILLAQHALNHAQNMLRTPRFIGAETPKVQQQCSTGTTLTGSDHSQPRQAEVPQIMAVAPKVHQPLAHTVAGKARGVAHTVPTGDGTNGQIRQQNSRQNRLDHIRAEVFVRNAEIGQETHGAPAHRATASMNTKPLAHPRRKNHKAPVKPVPMHLPTAACEQANRKTRGAQITPLFDVALDIYTERNRLFAWFRVLF